MNYCHSHEIPLLFCQVSSFFSSRQGYFIPCFWDSWFVLVYILLYLGRGFFNTYLMKQIENATTYDKANKVSISFPIQDVYKLYSDHDITDEKIILKSLKEDAILTIDVKDEFSTISGKDVSGREFSLLVTPKEIASLRSFLREMTTVSSGWAAVNDPTLPIRFDEERQSRIKQ